MMSEVAKQFSRQLPHRVDRGSQRLLMAGRQRREDPEAIPDPSVSCWLGWLTNSL